MSTNNDRLSDKERALITAARQSLAAKGAKADATDAAPAKFTATGQAGIVAPPVAPSTAPPVISKTASSPVSRPAAPAMDAAARIALLMQAEREANEARKQRLRRWGIHVPLGILILLVLWAAATTLRQVLR